MPCRSKIFTPQLYTCLTQKYKLATLKKDLLSGITVAILTLSLCMEIAIASGVAPEVGLYAAVVAGLIVSICGGSKVGISGPTPALIVVVYGIMQNLGYGALCLSTLIASAILILFGTSKIGSWIKFIPSPLVIGFTSGIAVTLFSDQITMFLGLPIHQVPSHFIAQISSYIQAVPHLDLPTAAIGIITLSSLLGLIKYYPNISWGITAIILLSLLCHLFSLPIETIQSTFGEIPSHFPSPKLPDLNIPQGSLGTIILNGIMIACIISLESLLSAIIGKEITHDDYKPNTELIAQGLANAGILLFGGIPSSGLVLLTAANAKAGAKTPIAGVIRAILLLLILWLLAPIVSKIPLVALATVLMVVSIELFELHLFIRFLKAPMTDRVVLLTSFTLTIIANVTAAVFIGIAIACILLIRQISKKPYRQKINSPSDTIPTETPHLYVCKMPDAFFFGNGDLLQKLPPRKNYILDMEQTAILDASGMLALEKFYRECEQKDISVSITHVQHKIFHQAKKFGILKVIPAYRFTKK
ncbi:MAG: SulP family inorganic anion transporter [Chlamydiia bacterium]